MWYCGYDDNNKNNVKTKAQCNDRRYSNVIIIIMIFKSKLVSFAINH